MRGDGDTPFVRLRAGRLAHDGTVTDRSDQVPATPRYVPGVPPAAAPRHGITPEQEPSADPPEAPAGAASAPGSPTPGDARPATPRHGLASPDADADAPDSDVRDEADDPDPSAPEPRAPEPAASVAPGTPATIALTPTRAYVAGLAVLSLVSVVLVAGLVAVLADGRPAAWMVVPFVPHVVVLAVLWYLVGRPAVVTVDAARLTLAGPWGRRTVTAWSDIDRLTVTGPGPGHERGAATVEWTVGTRRHRVAVTADHTPAVLAALRRYAPADVAGGLAAGPEGADRRSAA